jgi:hypothetical protein
VTVVRCGDFFRATGRGVHAGLEIGKTIATLLPRRDAGRAFPVIIPTYLRSDINTVAACREADPKP